MALVLPLACVQFGSLLLNFCYLCVSAGLLCVLLLALPIPWLVLLLCCAVAAVAGHGGGRLRRPAAARAAALGATFFLLQGRLPFPAPCLRGDLRDDNAFF